MTGTTAQRLTSFLYKMAFIYEVHLYFWNKTSKKFVDFRCKLKKYHTTLQGGLPELIS